MRKSTIVVIFLCSSLAVQVLSAKGEQRYAVGVRKHVDHSAFYDRPFGDGDISYGVAYEYHEEKVFWQLALDYTPDVEGTNGVDYVLTPQLTLIAKDRLWRGGVGVLTSYVSADDDDDWTGLNWQFLLGIHLGQPGSLGLDLSTYYMFEKWSAIGDFEWDDIEFGGRLSFPF